MSSFKNLRIGMRLAVGYGIVVLLLFALTFVAVTRINALNDAVDSVVRNRYAKVALAAKIDQGVNLQARALRNAVIGSKDPEEVKSSLAQMQAAVDRNTGLMEKLKGLINTPKGEALYQVMVDSRASYAESRKQAVKLLQDGRAEDAGSFVLASLGPKQNAFFAAIQAMADFQSESMETETVAAEAAGRAAVVITLVIAAGAALAAIVLGIVITRSITGPVQQAVAVAEAVAAGDLSASIPVGHRDETGQLLAALRRMNANLVKIVGRVRLSSDSIATGSAQIATGNADLSQRTEEQASNLEQTAASMEEIAGTVRNSADTARQATQLAASASAAAQRGGVVVGEVVATMDDITASSHKIADIISVIDGIAFQTNILALNAAVEAARAGEQGRGFAVVASEVRSLAQRSAEAAKEIKGLIGASVDKVEAGSRLVGNAGAAMSDIVAQVKHVADLIGEISVATQEQTTGIHQVGEAVTQLDQVTQQNAALVEESAAAAESLKHQAARLVEAVSVFKLG